MACEGLKPVAAIYSTFLQRGFDQLIHDVCLQNLNVTFAMDRAGIVGADGPTHHGLLDIAYLRGYPNIILMAPKDEAEMRDMMLTAIDHNGPAALRYPRGNGSAVLEVLEANGLQDAVKVVRMGVADEIVTHGDPKLLLAKYGLDVEGMQKRVIESLRSDEAVPATGSRLRAVR
jgi:1-deoxy-D-xylulose-5-phosphate synthase